MKEKNNKKVGIITLHRVVNYGSVLQTYALQEVIKDLGYEVEIIDYFPERLTMIGMLKRIKNKGEKFKKSLIIRNIARLIILPSYIMRFNMFFSFLKKYIKMTDKMYTSPQELRNEQFDFDIYCTGSDQVWNCGWNEKFDYPYYLDFAPDSNKKIAYAASFGKSQLNTDEIAETKKYLSKYDSISLRELSGVKIVEDLGIKNSINVLDPTLLLNGNEWRKISSNKYKNENYILVYNLNRNKKIDNYAKNLSKKTGLKVKFLSYQLHEFYKKGKIYCNPDVEDFLALIDNAKYVITDSFHATAFSINFNTQFIIVYPGKYSTRLQSILKILDLENRVAKNEEDISVVENNIDFNNVNRIMIEQREKSTKWLKNALIK